ncbi:sigma-70 family RNA polymerase sigma factor [Blastopirellula sp. JC732]|uniref:Sigma-70 family RNA polymerase sigma factor n=1 Tax=Blastopirellula sediminis TaxID=2894196 RepID=A0A9X1SK56_9BACT|nr:sigma-70 family RNA polymerase sigma factor [Blastopirellula sediminis]MCC9607323.1 sigma-70 family RNA polymerase sigma factor [Blastopirellula sediminis]MCC9629384.1 sigma-70 family RNA polymerase sigma factor [Blastopirellula sediminis]
MNDPIHKLSPSQVAFVEELTAIQSSMKRFCISILAGDQGVEDVIQEANRVILEKANEFQQGTNLRAWAFEIVRRQALAYCKRRQREHKLLFNTELVDSLLERSLEIDPAQADQMGALKACIEKLDDAEKSVLRGRYWSEKTLSEVSLEIGRTVDALKRALFRIRKQLRACVRQTLAHEKA